MLESLVQYIREFLHAPESEGRWTNAQILYLINRAQLDIATKTHVLRGIHRMGIRSNVHIYDLPEDVIQVTRVDLNGCKLTAASHDDLDSQSCNTCWIPAQGRPINWVFDKHERNKLRLYPIPNSTNSIWFEASELYGLASFPFNANYPVETGGNLGANTAVYENSTPYGIVTDVLGQPCEINGYGTTFDILLDDLSLMIHYYRKPKIVSSMADDLDIPEEYHMAIKYYVAGHLLRQDQDSHSRSLGNDELKLYQAELRQIHKDSALDFTNGTHYSIPYRRT